MQKDVVGSSAVSEQRTRIFTKKADPSSGLCILIEDDIPCSNPVASRGLCNRHRSYMTRKGLLETYALPRQSRRIDLKPNPNAREGICALLENDIPCKAPATRRGLCRHHYAGIWQRPDLNLNDFSKPQPTIVYARGHEVQKGRCVVREYSDEKYSQCAGEVVARGLCKRHYRLLSQSRTLFDQIANPIPRLKAMTIEDRPTAEPVKPMLDRVTTAAQRVQSPKAPTDTERLLSPNDIGKILNVTGEAVKQWIHTRRLPAVKLANGFWKVRVRDFEAFLRARNDVGRRRVLITHALDGRMNVVVDAVRALGHEPILARNHVDALLKSLDHYPALFVINLGAKEFEPWKLAEKVRADKATRKIPILLVGDVDMNDAVAERAVRLSVQGFIKMPTDKESIQSEIGRIVNAVK